MKALRSAILKGQKERAKEANPRERARVAEARLREAERVILKGEGVLIGYREALEAMNARSERQAGIIEYLKTKLEDNCIAYDTDEAQRTTPRD